VGKSLEVGVEKFQNISRLVKFLFFYIENILDYVSIVYFSKKKIAYTGQSPHTQLNLYRVVIKLTDDSLYE
jgi:hypothetical protein